MRASFLLLKNSLLLSLGIFVASVAYANEGVVERLLNLPFRPGMDVILDNLEDLKHADIPVTANGQNVSIPLWVERGIDAAPKLISSLEMTYPGATFVFVGRDSLAWADIFDSFYRSLGQDNRVLRIPCSRDTLTSLAGNNELILRYLEHFGLNPKSVLDGERYIFVDTISRGYGQQLRTFVAALYTYYEEHAGKVTTLLDRVNIFGLQVSTFAGKMISFLDKAKFLKEEAKRYSAPGFDKKYFEQHRILMYPIQPNAINELGYEHFTLQWHGSSGQATFDPDTKELSVILGQPNPIEQRQAVLWQQRAFATATLEPAFLDQVRFEALLLNYDFPVVRVEQLKPLTADQVSTISKDLTSKIVESHLNKQKQKGSRGQWVKAYEAQFQQQIAPSIDQTPIQGNKPSQNGKMLASQIRRWSSVEGLGRSIYFLKLVKQYKGQSLLTKGDLPELLEAILEGDTLWSLTNPRLRKVILEGSEFRAALKELSKSKQPSKRKIGLISEALLAQSEIAECEEILEEEDSSS